MYNSGENKESKWEGERTVILLVTTCNQSCEIYEEGGGEGGKRPLVTNVSTARVVCFQLLHVQQARTLNYHVPLCQHDTYWNASAGQIRVQPYYCQVDIVQQELKQLSGRDFTVPPRFKYKNANCFCACDWQHAPLIVSIIFCGCTTALPNIPAVEGVMKYNAA